MHIVNGQRKSIVIDDDVPTRNMEGMIGVQVHVGGPMKVAAASTAFRAAAAHFQ